MDDIKGLTPHASRVNGTVPVATIPWRFTYLCWNIPNVFLEAAPCFRSNALLLCAHGNPTIFAHPVENGGSRKKTVSFRNAFDWLGSENTRSKTAHFIIRNCYRSRDCCSGEMIV